MANRTAARSAPSGADGPKKLMGSARTTRRIVALFSWAVTGALVGYLYALATNGSPIDSACIGATILAGITLFEQFSVDQPWGEWLRRSSLLVFVSMSAMVWMVVIALSLYTIPGLLGAPPGWFEQRLAQTAFTVDVTFSAVAALLLNTAMRLRSLAGRRGLVLSEVLLGRVDLPAGVRVKELGMIELKGKAEPIELYEAVDN